MTADAAPAGGAGKLEWSSRSARWLLLIIAIEFVLGAAIRALLLPSDGLTGDLDVFVQWTHGIAVNGLPNAYDQNLSFPPVMAYIWGILAAIQPAFQTVDRLIGRRDPGADEDAGDDRRHRPVPAGDLRACATGRGWPSPARPRSSSTRP